MYDHLSLRCHDLVLWKRAGSARVFWCRRGGIDLSNAYSVVPAWPHFFFFDRSIKQRNPVLLD